MPSVGYTEEELIGIWEEFIRDNFYSDLLMVNDVYPAVKTLKIPLEDIIVFDSYFAEDLIDDPERNLRMGEIAIQNLLGTNKSISIAISAEGKHILKKITELTSEDVGKLVYVDCSVRKVRDARPIITLAAYKCSDCGGITYESVDGDRLVKPDKCDICGKYKGKVQFKLLPEESFKMDFREIEVQDNPEDLNGSEQPRRLDIFLYDSLAKEKIRPGDRVGVVGILKAIPMSFGNSQSAQMRMYIHAKWVEKKSKDWSSIELSDTDIDEIKKLAENNDVLKLFKQSIAPTIWGHDVIKEALVLQLFGGLPKKLEDGTRLRGDIHILLIGDPGTAKSTLLMQVTNIAPRAIYSSGKGTSAAGLTAAAIKDKNNMWTLEAGALVLADKGMACIDELDKISPQDRDSIHTAMEQQIVSVNKAGIHVHLPSRCSILAAANPKYGRFDTTSNLLNQIDLEPALINRFDAIFKIVDSPNQMVDNAIASHILDTHANYDAGIREPPVSLDLLRKYIVYAKSITPRLTKEAMQYIQEHYIKMRTTNNSYDSQAVASTPRQLEAMIRFAEASARVRLSDTVDIQDAKIAYHIVKQYLQDVAVNTDGIVDIDVLYGMSASDRALIKSIWEYVQDLNETTYRDVYREFSKYGEEKIDSAIEKLRKDGKIKIKNSTIYSVY